MRPLEEVDNFGAIDADTDELLRDCFQDHPAYLAARDFKKFLLIGRKGSGKTAIYRKLIQEREHDVFAFGYSFDDYPWHHHDLQAQVGVPEERRYIHSWKYLMLLGLAKVLLNQDQSQPWSDDSLNRLAAVEEFVVDSYGSRDPDLTQLFSPQRVLKFKATAHLTKYLDVSGERIPVPELPTHVQEVNRMIEDLVIESLNPELSYFVCFDQLDLGFSLTDETYRQRLVGLVLAARDLVLSSKERERRLNVVVFLRDDIYQDLQFEDKNKITENYVAEVRWDQSEGPLTLRKLMESRFSIALAEDDRSVSWNEVFDESREMPSRQSKYRHITDRTFMRPRDVIKFCNAVLADYRGKNDNDVPGKFSNSNIHDAREAYSEYLLNELDDEIAKHIPDYKSHLAVLRSLGSVQFTREQFDKEWAERSEGDPASAGQVLQQLFEFSVVGYLKSGGRGGGSEYVWRYLDPRARFDDHAETFRVHAGFKEALDLTRGG